MKNVIFAQTIIMEYMEKLLRRKIDAFLSDWKDKKPLIVKGARQVGKTRSIEWFAYNNYKSVVQINFVEQPKYKSIFDNGFEVGEILKNISLLNCLQPHISIFGQGKQTVSSDEDCAQCPQPRLHRQCGMACRCRGGEHLLLP